MPTIARSATVRAPFSTCPHLSAPISTCPHPSAPARTVPVTSLCIFCGSSPGARPEYRDAAAALGGEVARRGIRLVYGGGHVGLMGVVADAALAAGGAVVGVITEGLQAREVGHTGLPDLRVVATMHERKALMASLADAFVALPGGAGTLDEFFEMWTWLQLGIHRKPVGLLNVAGYYDGLLAFVDRCVEDRFIRAEYLDALVIDTEVARLLERLERTGPVRSDKWLDRTAPPRP
jgi:uncharacterized protein (TIGR00730 family)